MAAPILNYTTSISVDKTVAEIQKVLSKCNNIQVLTSYDQGIVSSISFRLQTKHGQLSFMLPAKIDAVHKIMARACIPRSLKTREQAARVAWRIIKDWIEAQIALVQAEQVTMEEAFLPFVQDHTGKTLYESLATNGFKNLALPCPGDNS